MLWITGIVSALKGMIKVPNIVGKTTTQATADLTSAHLTNTGNTTENTEDSNLGTKVKTQSPVADTLVNYESNVSYVSYVFSFTPFSVFSFTPFSVFGFTPANGSLCTTLDKNTLNCKSTGCDTGYCGSGGPCSGGTINRCF